MHQEMDDGNKTSEFLAMVDPTSASSSTHPLQISPKPYCKNDEAEPTVNCLQPPRPLNQNIDAKKIRRNISNRASAYRCRWRENRYICYMEGKAKVLETTVMMLSPQVGFYQKQNEMLLIEHESLKQKFSNYTSNHYHKEAEIEQNKLRVKQLRLILDKQREITQKQALYMGKMASHGDTNNPEEESTYDQNRRLNASILFEIFWLSIVKFCNNHNEWSPKAQIGNNTGEETSQLSKTTVKQGKKEELPTWVHTPWVPKMVPTMTPSMGCQSKPQPKKNSTSEDPLSLSLSIN